MTRKRTNRKLEDVDSENYRETFQKLQNIIRAGQERLMSSNKNSTENGEEKFQVRHILSCSGVLIEDGEVYTSNCR